MDFITTYMPAAVELTQEEVYSVRERLAAYCLTVAPDVETNPNSVIGDLIVSPQAYVIAAIENAMTKFASDLDLENVANGTVYNCDFVGKWLENFAVNSSFRLRASGVIRLTFTELKEYIFDRHIRFESEGNIFSLYLPNLGEYHIYLPGEEVPEGVNGTVLHDTGTDTYFADIVVLGETLAEEFNVVTGSTFTPSHTIPELDTAVALIDFDPGAETVSIPDLARRARATMYSASLNTRNGAVQYVKMICPFIEGVYAVHNGDREMLRDFDNPFASSLGCLDLYVRSKGYNYTEVQQVKLYLSGDESTFEGDFPFVGQPYHIESVTHESLPEIANLEHTITSHFAALPNTGTAHPGAIAAYTPKETCTLSIPNMEDTNGDSRFSPGIEKDGRRYALFTVTYQTDPMLREISQTVENEDYRPINTSILVRGFIPVILERFEVVYVREPGVLPDLEEAATRIRSYMGNLGAPDVYSEAEIGKIMHDCGVKYMKGVNVKAHVQWVIGEKLEDRHGNVVDVHPLEITTSAGLRVTYPADGVNLSPDDMYSCSPRNIRYWFLEGALNFKEVRDI